MYNNENLDSNKKSDMQSFNEIIQKSRESKFNRKNNKYSKEDIPD